MRGHGHVARGQRAAHGGAGGALAGGFDGVQRLGLEAEFAAHALQQGEIPGALGAETKIVAHQHITRLQPFHQNAAHEILGGKRGEAFAEAADMDMGHAQIAQDFQLLAQGSQAGGGGLRREDFARMRFEGQYGGRRAHRSGARGQPRQHGLVAKMNAVEIADGDGIRAITGGPAMGHQHGACISLKSREF